MKTLMKFLVTAWLLTVASLTSAANQDDYRLATSDLIKITVFQNPDLTIETRVSESGTISYPLIGQVNIGGLSTSEAEKLIADQLRNGNFVKKPQVNIALVEIRGSQVAVLGMVNKPGRFALEGATTKLSDLIAMAGGVAPGGGTGSAVITGNREGKPFRTEADIASLYLQDSAQQDLVIHRGDVIYVASGSMVSVLGEVNKAGRFPLENLNMRLSQVLALAGGVTAAASDAAIVTGIRNGAAYYREVDVPSIFLTANSENDILILPGDEIYIHKAPVFYIYGEAQKPGSYRVERNMTVIQALAQGGGPTARGTQRNIKVLRKKTDGAVAELSPKLTDPIQPDDVIYVRESLF